MQTSSFTFWHPATFPLTDHPLPILINTFAEKTFSKEFSFPFHFYRAETAIFKAGRGEQGTRAVSPFPGRDPGISCYTLEGTQGYPATCLVSGFPCNRPQGISWFTFDTLTFFKDVGSSANLAASWIDIIADNQIPPFLLENQTMKIQQ